ncbi:hypothetical protein B0T14DRAFT_564199 [Immersiella caudata]|uniref:Uncharacterized protein n=1 Tax=Immersiella caudata TaxID=314043 RepID=A0AA39WW82_9PEZI|nr:hypothetical protein B0T14DRAFT_564199 [Immersiella caudata]
MPRRDTCQCLFLSIEFVLCIVALCVFVHGHASGLRTALWTVGGEQGWNSNPRLRIYFYANHREPPEIPSVWTESLADSLLGIAIISTAFWMTRMVLFQCSIGPPWIGATYDLILSGLWTYGVKAQSSSDLTDTQHLSEQPWYLQQSCADISGDDGVLCGHGRACFSVAVVCMYDGPGSSFHLLANADSLGAINDRIFYFCRAVWSVLRLAYWCGQYDVLDRCVDLIGELSFGSRWERQHEDSRHFFDNPRDAAEGIGHDRDFCGC